MSFAYKELAQKAAEAERRAQFADATEIWNKAYYEARDRDQSWVITRIDFCNSAVKNARGMWQ
ncbi:ANR family transcriptional regulator [Serratia fonticola]|uniref:ANR family transcriptional regulator n=1 Tax=Serratia fonticola TaxID=47917 RepID=UPI003BB80C99